MVKSVIEGKNIHYRFLRSYLTYLYCQHKDEIEFLYKASFTLSRFLVQACGLRSQPGPHRGDAGKHRIESGYIALNRRSPGSGPGGFNFCKQPRLTGTHRAAIQRRLIPGHHRSSSDMKRISTVRPPGETVANRHELCPRWRYFDSCRSNYGLAR